MHNGTIRGCITTSYIFPELEASLFNCEDKWLALVKAPDWMEQGGPCVRVWLCLTAWEAVKRHFKITEPALQSGSRAAWEFSSQLRGRRCFCRVKNVVLAKNTQPQTRAIVFLECCLCVFFFRAQKGAHLMSQKRLFCSCALLLGPWARRGALSACVTLLKVWRETRQTHEQRRSSLTLHSEMTWTSSALSFAELHTGLVPRRTPNKSIPRLLFRANQ